jgi:hypothetical protein
MIKLVTLLALTAVVYAVIAASKDGLSIVPNSEKISPNSENQASALEEAGAPATISSAHFTWETYTDEEGGFSFKYPPGVQIKTLSDDSLEVSRLSMIITFHRHPLLSQDLINTVAEQDINSKVEKLGDRFRLLRALSPIALGQRTGLTYSSEELGRVITYFYVPQTSHYLLIINETEDPQGADLISLSDHLIFSLELLAD